MKLEIVGIISSTSSSIIVNSSLEIGDNSSYTFTLSPEPGFHSDSIIQITLPSTMEAFSPCQSSLSGSCKVVSPNIIQLEGATSDQPIIITVQPIRNPINICPFADIIISVVALCQTNLSLVYHKSIDLKLSNTGFYQPHTLADLTIQGSFGANYTVTNETYEFSFKNEDFEIVSGCSIGIKFPEAMQFLTPTPTIDFGSELSPSEVISLMEII